MNGHPRYTVEPHQTYVYEFGIRNRVGTYWFHPHPDGRTGKQVYVGIAGLFIVSDRDETAIDVPSGPYDVPLVIQDRTFDRDNQLVYLSGRAQDGMMGGGRMGGGRMRGGMMGGAMMGGMMSGSSLPDGAAFPILEVRVVRPSSTRAALPQQLSTIPVPRPQDAINASRPKIFDITMGMMAWGVNGRSFQMDGVTAEETVKLGTSEIWEFRNDATTGMTGMMANALHVHGLQYRVLERSIAPQFSAGSASVSAGHVDAGWKDTVLLMPGERVRLLLEFESYDGLYLYHCHMLEHEDSGLMRNYLIKA